jgi:pSer/pThr/pTyr-binding forkhead associated (FHA) protein
MQIKLRIIGGKSAGQEIAVAGPTFAIGKGPSCQLRPRSEAVADEHCLLQLEPGLVRVIDRGSATGTLVNGERVEGSQELKAGDVLKVGPIEFEMVVVASLAAKKKPKVSGVEDAASRMAGAGRGEVDVSQWLDNDDAPQAPSRYAAQFNNDEKRALGMESDGAPAAPVPPAKPAPAVGADETSDAASQVLNKLMKRR